MVVLQMGYIKGRHRKQMTLFPETIDDYITDNNSVKVIDAFVDCLDMAAIGFKNTTPKTQGRPSYDPRILLKLYIYGYFNKIRSSRKLMQECRRNLEVMWLIGKLTPDFRTIADFRKDNARALKKVFRQFVRICNELNLYSREMIAIDGSKFRAVNSKDHNVTSKKLEQKFKRVDKSINEYLEALDKYDKNESDTKELTKEEIQEKIVALRQRKEKYNTYLEEMQESGETQLSFVDSESRLMKTKNGAFEVCYNVQTAVDVKNHMIVNYDVTNKCNDMGLLKDNANETKEQLDTDVIEVIADKGYESKEDLLDCLKAGIIPHVSLRDEKIKIELISLYNDLEITPETKDSTKPQDIKKCLEAGILPTVYENRNIDIEVIEEIKQVKNQRCFILNESDNTVICPEGKILRKAAYFRKKAATRYVSRSACRKCKNKCTAAKFKQLDLRDGQKKLCLKSIDKVEKKVKITLKPNKEKLKLRKCIVEHPYGTIKRWCDGSYVLMKGMVKASADLSLSFLTYNLKRAINILGFEKLIEALMQISRHFSPLVIACYKV